MFAYTHIMNPVIPPPLAHHLEVVVEVHPDSFKPQIFTDLHLISTEKAEAPGVLASGRCNGTSNVSSVELLQEII